ncbi:MAG: hypothetical protein M1828_000271 [Chrysothrix sp. TS-e1954]|nr:MAG: hypothetical protein M1828_000271 [Chrysothrix sp. TS-e1954]
MPGAANILSLLIHALTLCVLPKCGLAYTGLSDEALTSLPNAEKDFDIRDGKLLAPILRPRVPGTTDSLEVLQHFVDFFRTSLPEWRLDFQNSTSTTPTSEGKEIPFHNLIATRDPPWAASGDVGRLALVAHYDSLSTLEGFIGAIDSAAPCAMLMQTAKSIDSALTKKWKSMTEQQADLELVEEKGIQILLLDGEEAFLHWSHTDSTYGARALAEEWENTAHTATSTFSNALSSISLFVLLDLLGSANPNVPSYYLTTHWAYRNMAKLERRLRDLGLFKSSAQDDTPSTSNKQYFLPDIDKSEENFFASGIEDDHIPFLARGVEVLHIIPSPFPYGIWHEMADDGEHLDMDTVEDWTRLVTAFAAEWMELEEYMPKQRQSQVRGFSSGRTEL